MAELVTAFHANMTDEIASKKATVHAVQDSSRLLDGEPDRDRLVERSWLEGVFPWQSHNGRNLNQDGLTK